MSISTIDGHTEHTGHTDESRPSTTAQEAQPTDPGPGERSGLSSVVAAELIDEATAQTDDLAQAAGDEWMPGAADPAEAAPVVGLGDEGPHDGLPSGTMDELDERQSA